MGKSKTPKESNAARTARVLGEKKGNADGAALLAQANWLRNARRKPLLDVTPAVGPSGVTNRLGVQ